MFHSTPLSTPIPIPSFPFQPPKLQHTPPFPPGVVPPFTITTTQPYVYHQHPNPYYLNSQMIPNPYYTPHHHFTNPIQISVDPLVSESSEPWKLFDERDQMRRIIEQKLELSFYPMDWCVNFERFREILIERYPELTDDFSYPPFEKGIGASVVHTPPLPPTSVISPPPLQYSPYKEEKRCWKEREELQGEELEFGQAKTESQYGITTICESSELESSMDQFKKDTHQCDMEEFNQSITVSHVPASSKVSSSITFEISAPLLPPLSSKSLPQCALSILPSITTTRQSKPIENFIKNTTILHTRNLFDNILEPNICHHCKLNQAYCSHDPYHYCVSVKFPPPLPPSKPPDISPCFSSPSASQLSLSYSIVDISLEGPMPNNIVDNVWVTDRTLVKAQVVLNETNHMLVKDVFFNEVLKLRSGTALVDMYSKFGNVEKALEVFCKSSEKDISTWNSMIAGLSTHGFGEHALIIFSQLLAKGYKPNEVTFIGVLSAWSRAGLLNEGRKMFDLMVHAHEIQPTIEHYGCMVDLLGRHGLLEEAEELARTRSLIEAPVVWESLLSACKNHGNLELRKHVAGKFLELKPQDSAGYVQLSNTYASMGKWKDVKEVRKRMKAQSVTGVESCTNHFLASYLVCFHQFLFHSQPPIDSHFVKMASYTTISKLFTWLGGLLSVEKDGIAHAKKLLLVWSLSSVHCHCYSLETEWDGEIHWSCMIMALFQISVPPPEIKTISAWESLAAVCKCNMVFAIVKGIRAMCKSCKSQRVPEEVASTLIHFNIFVGENVDVLEALMHLTHSPTWSWWIIMEASFFKGSQEKVQPCKTRGILIVPSLRTSLLGGGWNVEIKNRGNPS